MNSLWLFLKNLLFTLLVPGFVVGWVPLRWFERYPSWPGVWRWPQYAAAALFLLGAAAFLACQWLFAVRGQGTPTPSPALGFQRTRGGDGRQHTQPCHPAPPSL